MKPTNGELNIMIQNLNNNLEEKHADNIKAMKAILDELRANTAQTIKTNGRVTDLEKWQFYMKGGLVVISALLVPVAIYFITQTISKAKEHATIQQAVGDGVRDGFTQLLNKYDFQPK